MDQPADLDSGLCLDAVSRDPHGPRVHGPIQRNALETSGAVMPGDIVTTTDAAMNVTVKVTTNSDGVGSLLFVHVDVHKGA